MPEASRQCWAPSPNTYCVWIQNRTTATSVPSLKQTSHFSRVQHILLLLSGVGFQPNTYCVWLSKQQHHQISTVTKPIILLNGGAADLLLSRLTLCSIFCSWVLGVGCVFSLVELEQLTSRMELGFANLVLANTIAEEVV